MSIALPASFSFKLPAPRVFVIGLAGNWTFVLVHVVRRTMSVDWESDVLGTGEKKVTRTLFPIWERVFLTLTRLHNWSTIGGADSGKVQGPLSHDGTYLHGLGDYDRHFLIWGQLYLTLIFSYPCNGIGSLLQSFDRAAAKKPGRRQQPSPVAPLAWFLQRAFRWGSRPRCKWTLQLWSPR